MVALERRLELGLVAQHGVQLRDDCRMDALELRLELGLVAQQQAVGVERRNPEGGPSIPLRPRIPFNALQHLRLSATGPKIRLPIEGEAAKVRVGSRSTPGQSVLQGQDPARGLRGGLAPIRGGRLRRVTLIIRVRVAALVGQPTAALLKRHEQGLRLGQVLLCQLGALDLEGGAGDVGGADGDLGPGGRQAHGRDAVPHADRLAAERVEHDGGRVDLLHARDTERVDDARADLVDGLAAADLVIGLVAAADLGRARGAPGERDAECLHAEELVVGEHGGDDERQVVRRHAGAHDLALGVGHGGVALNDVGVLVDRRHERKKATDAEEQDEGEQEGDEQHTARLLEVQARLQEQESEQGDS
eukprot:scaffold34009_cov55-Phaeocystis_antarctica.AAC.2